jgi:hypothetical protein
MSLKITLPASVVKTCHRLVIHKITVFTQNAQHNRLIGPGHTSNIRSLDERFQGPTHLHRGHKSCSGLLSPAGLTTVITLLIV